MHTDASATSPRPFLHGYRTITLIGAFLVAVIGFGAYACQSLEGGPVRSDAEYRERVAQTKQAGMAAVRALAPAPEEAAEPPGRTLDDIAQTGSSTSCVDDFGVDDGGVTRDEPIFFWELTFAGHGDYLAAVDDLRREWKRRGLTVKDVPAPGKGEPGAGLPGLTTTDEQGVEVSFRPDWYSGKPVVRADGGCMRHGY
ncbi:hypothetical protein [Streptomyces herbicida]|uniref:hypothetical protein n=1 Tax=Streptomyces herbicida TaxID=3065675 RepID=UPI00292E84A5|nr:hypothetical protein [Streptomyces sp. NEAU-HV9]